MISVNLCGGVNKNGYSEWWTLILDEDAQNGGGSGDHEKE